MVVLRRRLICLLLAAGFLATGPGMPGRAMAAPIEVIFAFGKARQADPLHHYRVALLRLALETCACAAGLTLAPYRANQARLVRLVAAGDSANVMFMGTSRRAETDLLPVRVPIFLGLGSGYRIGLIHRDSQPALAGVENLEDLRRYRVGQGEGWADTAILRAAGVPVVESAYRTLFPMLARKRFDWFSRGLFEVFGDHDAHAAAYPDLAVERTLLVVYPFAIYFFVSPGHPAVHDVLFRGLRRAYDDGAMQRLMRATPAIAAAVQRAGLDRRRRIALPSAGLTPETEQALRRFTPPVDWLPVNWPPVK